MTLPRHRRLVLALAAAAIAAAAAHAPARAQGLGLARESAVKAAFLYKFGGFVEWPQGTFRSAASPLVIGVYGDEAVASELEQLTQGRDIAGRPVVVQRLRDAEDAADLHILFAGGTRDMRAREVLGGVRGPVLTVANGPAGGRAVLYFSDEQGRVRFSASLPAATARGLRLSARLLTVAQHVEGAR